MLQEGLISNGDLIAFFSYTVFIGTAIAGLGNFYTELVGAMGATERIRTILGEEGEIEIGGESDSVESLKVNGNIRFNQVKFQYPTRELELQMLSIAAQRNNMTQVKNHLRNLKKFNVTDETLAEQIRQVERDMKMYSQSRGQAMGASKQQMRQPGGKRRRPKMR